jgi:transmembrane sensor
VKAGKLNIEVLGTRFNVCAYPGDQHFSATLEEGSVNAVNTSNGQQSALKPGEQLVLNTITNQFKNQQVNTELYTSWKENVLRFDDATFEELITKMEHWYDVKITVDQSVDTNERYTMTIKTESLREMLSLISKTTTIKYKINGNTVLISKP